MSITGGFGVTIDFKSGVSRKWIIGRDGVKRWADNGQQCAATNCHECHYCSRDEVRSGDDFKWGCYCDLATPGGENIVMGEDDLTPEWCPLLLQQDDKSRL